jgi:hypothetical protein
MTDKAHAIVVKQLGWTADNLHRIAREWQGDPDSPDRAAYREAADIIHGLQKELKWTTRS